MPPYEPIQTAFTAGELSSRLRARVEVDQYRYGADFLENWVVEPQGPIRRRAGSQYVATWPEAGEVPRLFELRVSGSDEDYVVAVGATKLRIYQKSGGLLTFHQNLFTNGGFNASLAGWSVTGIGTVWSNGTVHVPGFNPATHSIQQTISTVAGRTYFVKFRARRDADVGLPALMFFDVIVGGVSIGTHQTQLDWTQGSFAFFGSGSPVTIVFASNGLSPTANYLDDVVVYDNGATLLSEFASPWTADQIPALQASSELSKGRLFFVHREVQPRVLSMPVADVFEFYATDFANQPPSWGGANWPGVVEAGFQGRLWLASTPADPHNLWASKSGSPFDFGLGTGVDSDAISLTVTTKGQIEWLQGQRVLLAGSEAIEHHIQGSQGLITPTDFEIQDGSAFGSTGVQARHIGDQVLWVDRSKRKIRAIDYSWERQAWFSRAVTFISEHLFDSDIEEVNWALAPDPCIVARLLSGELRCCTYDRGENVLAWWRLALPGGTIGSACVARSAHGDEVWAVVSRGATITLERVPLHETNISHLDCSVVGILPVGQVVSGLAHLEGREVYALVDGALEGPFTVAGGQITVEAEFPASVDVGLAYTATMRTLRPEGGWPGGTAQGAKQRRVAIGVRLNDSALPLINGQRPPDRTPSTPMDTPEPRRTGDFVVQNLGWDSEGVVTIVQDLPFRTEVLGVFGTVAVNKV